MRFRQNRVEWALLGLIAVLCVVLSFLQYAWTGELARSEPALLRAGLTDQLRRLVQTFNDDIRENCKALVPTSVELTQLGVNEAHRVRYQQWFGSHDRALFTRVGVARPEHGNLQLYSFDGSGNLTSAECPDTWSTLRVQMSAKIRGEGRPPEVPSGTTILETPIFEVGGGPGAELEWMIFELNADDLRTQVLPRLVADYLGPVGDAAYDVSTRWPGPAGHVIFSSRADGGSVENDADASAGIFPNDLMGAAGPPGRGKGRPEDGRFRWTISVRHRAGSLAAAVAQAQRRNLIASLLLVGLLGGTAWALVRYTARSRRLAEMQFQFAAGVSHDLRTPLTAIRGAAFNLYEGVVQEPATIRRYLELILRNAEELTAMIENVLAFSASVKARVAPRDPISIGELLEHAVGAVSAESEQAACRIELSVSPALPIVRGDRDAVELVFRNLISNAIRHGADGKWVGISATSIDNGVEVRVRDHGPGIPQAERQRIFEPFYRGTQTRAQRVPGTGLGLSLAKNTIEQHRGTVDVDDLPEGGTQFTVRLPANQQDL